MDLSIKSCSINSAKVSLSHRNDRDIQCILCNVKGETAAGLNPPPIDGLETEIKNVINVNAHDVLLDFPIFSLTAWHQAERLTSCLQAIKNITTTTLLSLPIQFYQQ